MTGPYFNYDHSFAAGPWGHRTFLRHWWHFYRHDPHWVPPTIPPCAGPCAGASHSGGSGYGGPRPAPSFFF